MRRRVAIAPWLPAGALIGHAVLVTHAVVTAAGLDLSLVNAVSAVAGLTALFAWIGSLGGALPGVSRPWRCPVAAVAALLPLLLANPHRFSFTDEPWAALHIAVALIAYATAHRRRVAGAGPDGSRAPTASRTARARAAALPPLLTLERFLFRLSGVGFAC